MFFGAADSNQSQNSPSRSVPTTPAPVICASRPSTTRSFQTAASGVAQSGTMISLVSEENWMPRLALIRDRKSVVLGKSVSVSVDIGGRRVIKKKTKTQKVAAG